MTTVRLTATDSRAIISALKDRRTCRTFTTQDVSRSVVEDLLDAARWAPNHRLTNPWRFFVVEKASPVRATVAAAVWSWTHDNVKNPNVQRRVDSADAARDEVLRAPALIYAFSVPGADEEVTTENYAATCCAIQNLQLAAYAHGLAVGWSTGKPAKSLEIPALLGAGADWRMVGALFCGYPATSTGQERRPLGEVVQWV